MLIGAYVMEDEFVVCKERPNIERTNIERESCLRKLKLKLNKKKYEINPEHNLIVFILIFTPLSGFLITLVS